MKNNTSDKPRRVWPEHWQSWNKKTRLQFIKTEHIWEIGYKNARARATDSSENSAQGVHTSRPFRCGVELEGADAIVMLNQSGTSVVQYVAQRRSILKPEMSTPTHAATTGLRRCSMNTSHLKKTMAIPMIHPEHPSIMYACEVGPKGAAQATSYKTVTVEDDNIHY